MTDEKKEKELICTRQTCINVLNRLSGVFLANDIELAIEKDCPDVSAGEILTKGKSAEIKEWKLADKKCRGHLLQHLCEQDYDQVGSFSARDIQDFLRDKYASEKTNAGIGNAVHSVRRNNIYDSDNFEQATTKINNILSGLASLDSYRVNGLRICLVTDQLKVAWIVDSLPPYLSQICHTICCRSQHLTLLDFTSYEAIAKLLFRQS